MQSYGRLDAARGGVEPDARAGAAVAPPRFARPAESIAPVKSPAARVRLHEMLALALLMATLAAGLLSSQTSAPDRPMNTAASTVTLSDDDSGSAMFNLANLAPGDTASRCARVTYGGGGPADVTLRGATAGSGLAEHLDLTVEEPVAASLTATASKDGRSSRAPWPRSSPARTAATRAGCRRRWGRVARRPGRSDLPSRSVTPKRPKATPPPRASPGRRKATTPPASLRRPRRPTGRRLSLTVHHPSALSGPTARRRPPVPRAGRGRIGPVSAAAVVRSRTGRGGRTLPVGAGLSLRAMAWGTPSSGPLRRASRHCSGRRFRDSCCSSCCCSFGSRTG